jgi:PEP-CTERM motif
MRKTLRPVIPPVLAITLILMITAMAANASLTTYSTPASFNSATTGLTTQTFGFLSATIPTGGSGAMNNPLNSATSNAFVSPGDIAAGLDIAALSNNGNDILLIGPNFNGFGNTNYEVFANDFGTPLQLTLSPGVTAFSMGVLASATTDVQISVYSPSSALLGSVTLLSGSSGIGTFLGVTSGSPIGSVVLTGPPQFIAVGVDQVQFGSAVPEPGTLLLLGSGLLGAVGTLKKRLR